MKFNQGVFEVPVLGSKLVLLEAVDLVRLPIARVRRQQVNRALLGRSAPAEHLFPVLAVLDIVEVCCVVVARFAFRVWLRPCVYFAPFTINRAGLVDDFEVDVEVQSRDLQVSSVITTHVGYELFISECRLISQEIAHRQGACFLIQLYARDGEVSPVALEIEV
uniref:Uncharacterized protein n=1 Tax=Strombidium inclinatum TaxID=197538 RepID=A0A7S3IVQ5_9SPIT